MRKPTLDKKMQQLVMTRGTKQSIIMKLALLSVNRTDFPALEPFENPIEGNDLGFNTNIGQIGDTYLDYEIYMLPTNVPDEFLITEVTSF